MRNATEGKIKFKDGEVLSAQNPQKVADRYNKLYGKKISSFKKNLKYGVTGALIGGAVLGGAAYLHHKKKDK